MTSPRFAGVGTAAPSEKSNSPPARRGFTTTLCCEMERLDTPGATEGPGGGIGTATDDPARTLVRVPGNHLMTDLLGPRDEFLDLIEDAFPRTVVTVRGNEVSVVGSRLGHGRAPCSASWSCCSRPATVSRRPRCAARST